MPHDPVPEEIKRFIMTSIPSVPYLEAMLLLRANPTQSWAAADTAQRLFVADKVAFDLLAALCQAGVLTESAPAQFCYQPRSDSLMKMIDQLADCYSQYLMPVTHLIHSKSDKRARQFAEAFKLRKDK